MADYFCSLWNKLFKKEKIKIYFNLKQKFGEDYLFNCEYLKNCDKVSFINDIVYNYVKNDESAINNFSLLRFQNHARMNDYTEKFLKVRYKNHDKFFDTIKSNCILSVFYNFITTKEISYKEKRKLLNKYKKDSHFNEMKPKLMSFKQKIFFVFLKLGLIRSLKLLFMIKG